ncbi:MAG: amidohydrolase family protein [Candidatus Geothermincolia bacterium]
MEYPVIDPHVHILPPRRMAGLIRWVRKFGEPFVPEDLSVEQALAGLQEAGIERFFNLVFPLWEEETVALNRWNRDLCARVPGAIPFGSLRLETPDKAAETRRCIEDYGFAGMKLHPYAQRFEPFVPEMRGLFEVLDAERKILLVHTGFDVFYGEAQNRAAMEETFRRYPHMTVVLVHSLFPSFDVAHRWMREFGQLYLDMTNVFSSLRLLREGFHNGEPVDINSFPADLQEILRNENVFLDLFRDFPDRIIYGSDYPVGMGPHVNLADDMKSFRLGEAMERALVSDNVIGLLERGGYEL